MNRGHTFHETISTLPINWLCKLQYNIYLIDFEKKIHKLKKQIKFLFITYRKYNRFSSKIFRANAEEIYVQKIATMSTISLSENQANNFEMTHPEELLVRFLMLEFIPKKHIPLKGSPIPNIDVHKQSYS